MGGEATARGWDVNSEEADLWARFADSMAWIGRAALRGSHLCGLRGGKAARPWWRAAGGRGGHEARFLTTGSGHTDTGWLTYSTARRYR